MEIRNFNIMPQNHGLGRGLASLIPQKNKKISEPKQNFNYFGAAGMVNNSPPEDSSLKHVREVEVSRIIPNPHQPRLSFDEEKLRELSESIKQYGILQPLVVTKNQDGYEIIAGERRFQAAKLAGLEKVPVIVREASEQQKLELAIIENIHRHDLNPIEEAKSYIKLSEEFELSQEEVAGKVGKSRSAVANKLRLLNLPVEIQRALAEGKITEGHAKAILAANDPEKQRAFFEMILKNDWTVRQTENKAKEVSVRSHVRSVTDNPELKSIEDALAGALGTKIKLSRTGEGGRIVIEYYSREELENIVNKISNLV